MDDKELRKDRIIVTLSLTIFLTVLLNVAVLVAITKHTKPVTDSNTTELTPISLAPTLTLPTPVATLRCYVIGEELAAGGSICFIQPEEEEG